MLPLKTNVDNYMQCNAYCPFCDSINFDCQVQNAIEVEGTIAWRDMQCPDCDKQWREEYSLICISIRSENYDTWYSDEAKHDGQYYSHEKEKT